MIPIRGDLILQAVLSGSRLNAQSRARRYLDAYMRTGGPRLWQNADQPRTQPFDFDRKHLHDPAGYPPGHGPQT